MLAFLVRSSIRFFSVVIALSIILLAYGGYRLSTAGLDIFPEFSPKQVVIQTEAPGFSAEQVEIQVSTPIETALSGLMGLTTTRSESIQGLSIVTALFNEKTDIYRNRQLISERLASLKGKLPSHVQMPVPVPLSSSSATVLTLGLTSSEKDLMALRTLVDWTIIPKILTVPGVADVNVFGGAIKQLQIQILPERLLHYDLSINNITAAATLSSHSTQAGFIENTNQRFTLNIQGLPQRPEQLKKIVIKTIKGHPLLLGDVANVDYAPAPAIGAAQVGGQEGIVLMVIGQYGANTLSVSRAVEKALVEFEPLFTQQNIDFHNPLFRPADYIETSLNNITGHLILGSFFVILVLYCFLYNSRTALISAVALPLSLIMAAIVLLEAHINLNIMVLGGLAIALGEVVDDAIIDTENIFRRLRENQQLEHPLPILNVIYKASMEVRSSVVYASFIVALAFVPLLTLDGVAGRLFAPLGIAYISAILMSLLVALTLTPALCFALLKNTTRQTPTPPVINYLQPRYHRLLTYISQHSKPLIALSVSTCLIGSLVLLSLGTKFLPELREGHYIVHTTSIPGTSLTESIRIGQQLTQQIKAIDGIESVSQWAGRAERGADTYGSHYSEFEVRLAPLSGASQQTVLDQLRETLAAFPGILYEANTFLIERVDETISGYTAPVVVNLYGNNLNTLDLKAQHIADIMASFPEASDIQLRSTSAAPTLSIQLNLDQLTLWGISPQQVSQTISTAYHGAHVGQGLSGYQTYDIVVNLHPRLKEQPHLISQLPIRSASGALIPLGELATVSTTTGRYNILHQGAQRLQTVTCHVNSSDLGGFIKKLKNKIFQEIVFDNTNYPEFTGSAIAQNKAREELILYSLLASAGILLLIYLALGSTRLTLLTLANIPFSLIGGVVAVLITGATLSIGSVVGFITLFGITVRNSIMLISHYQQLVQQENHPWNFDTVLLGAQQRLPSILMTALVTILAMLPLAINSDNAGREIMGPMAAIIIGGLVTSTVLNLLILPTILLHYGRFQNHINQK